MFMTQLSKLRKEVSFNFYIGMLIRKEETNMTEKEKKGAKHTIIAHKRYLTQLIRRKKNLASYLRNENANCI